MSDLGKTVVKKFGDKEVICRELTVAGTRKLIESESSGDLITEALFEDVRLGDLEVLTSLTKEDIEGMLPSELAVVVDACKKANPDFFGMLARLAKPRSPA
ncbi:hypothetical protein [Pseudomonas sp.]|uniref:hypothetical protein n=1 Tax=Pseudomonas sp. TaxID=306 RepID=UPI0027313164|nr:hypothetical protein [Pseudomonas sp.]MDP2244014.1 hypothetical protein [Pseudomonas sp.]